MSEYIDKSALVAEMKKRKTEAESNCGGYKSYDEHRRDACIVGFYEEFLEIINTLEAKEVDLDGERRKYLTEHFNVYEDGILQSKRSNLPLDTYDVIKITKHFFDLGMAARTDKELVEE